MVFGEMTPSIHHRLSDICLTVGWIDRNGPVIRPQRTPDLTSLELFLWDHMDILMHATLVNDEEGLRNRILATEDSMHAIQGIFERIRQGVRDENSSDAGSWIASCCCLVNCPKTGLYLTSDTKKALLMRIVMELLRFKHISERFSVSDRRTSEHSTRYSALFEKNVASLSLVSLAFALRGSVRTAAASI
ncbi:hypothetical protein ANN_04528 [Periplaneta americana]|uniref:Uncharacterized protein n=1 Tax=Periplaneta americana TaxID=6978 RepID=A0ABQ8T8S9_PERAM|nr:hypothetical protein ANN_04528 [Periplaneta americana]